MRSRRRVARRGVTPPVGAPRPPPSPDEDLRSVGAQPSARPARRNLPVGAQPSARWARAPEQETADNADPRRIAEDQTTEAQSHRENAPRWRRAALGGPLCPPGDVVARPLRCHPEEPRSGDEGSGWGSIAASRFPPPRSLVAGAPRDDRVFHVIESESKDPLNDRPSARQSRPTRAPGELRLFRHSDAGVPTSVRMSPRCECRRRGP